MKEGICLFVLMVLVNTFVYSQDTIRPAVIFADSLNRGVTSLIISKDDLKSIVTSTGERNPVQNIHYIAGVAMGVEGSSSFFVRGANPGNNLFTLDGVKIFGPGHLLGQASVVTNSVLENLCYNVGGFDGESSNMLAAHIDMSSKSGCFNDFKGEFSVSNFMIGAMSEGPIIKDKLSYIVSARISPLELEYRAVRNFMSQKLNLFNILESDVGDVFTKVSYNINKTQTLKVSLFVSSDYYSFGKSEYSYSNSIAWRNIIGNVVWDYMPSPRLAFNARISYNDYKNSQSEEAFLNDSHKAIGVLSKIGEISSNASLNYNFGRSWVLNAGLKVVLSGYMPEVSQRMGDDVFYVENSGLDRRSALMNMYAQIKYFNAKGELIKLALRGNAYVCGFDANDYRYFDFAPEVSLYWRCPIGTGIGLEATFDYLTQYYHTLEGLPLGWGKDFIVPSYGEADPEQSLQYYLGTYANFLKHKFSIGGYYRDIFNLLYFSEANEFFNTQLVGWQDLVEKGGGHSYGMEVEYEYNGSRLGAKVAYTYSKSFRQFDDINGGRPFLSSYDRPHVLNLSVRYEAVKTDKIRIGINSSFVYQSGNLVTLQSGYTPGYLPWEEDLVKVSFYNGEINNYRLKDYVRLDIGANCDLVGKNVAHEFYLGVYNVLNRHNCFSLYYNVEEMRWKQMYLFSLMPSLGYVIKF